MKDQNKIVQDKPNQNTQKKYTFISDSEREVAICISIQKLGKASINEIIEKIEDWGGKITEKQVSKGTENLRARDLLSIDLSEKDDNGISIKRYLMKKIKLAIPEIAQIKDLVDDPSINPLKEELDRSKGTRKKGLKTNDYYRIEVTFETEGLIQGFVPDQEGVSRHYRENEKIVIRAYCFQNWLRDNLPLINRSSNTIGDIRFFQGTVNLNGKVIIDERYITNIESNFHSSKGTGGRGTRSSECIPPGSKITTNFCLPRELIDPEKIQLAFKVMCENGKGFGANHKLTTGRLVNPQIKMLNDAIWSED